MAPQRLVIEADRCRSLARSFDGRPEQPFLLKIAAVFEDIAHPHTDQRSNPRASR